MKKSKSLMQSEIFIVIMIIIVMLYITTTIYASKLEKENKKYKDKNSTTCIEIKDLHNKNYGINNPTMCIKLKEWERLKKDENKTTCISEEKAKRVKNRKNLTICIDYKKLKKYKAINKRYFREKEEWKKHQKPPLITLSEDRDEFKFGLGDAKLTNKYKNALLNEKLPELINNITKYNCNIIEVYGYTDTASFKSKNKISINVDKRLHRCIEEDCNIDEIGIHSNLELGMTRAISIVHFLKQQQQNGLIKKDIIIKPYSAGQFIDEYGKISTIEGSRNRKRRRIEIRLSRSREINNW